ncbi:MAG: alpha/beta hydrolase fold domain-containing protein [Clostridiales bacterium]|nr:alpha/beta hydrolase fold domain-containing protein [Clostridiales bacterium]
MKPENKPFGVEDYADLGGSLRFDAPGDGAGGPPAGFQVKMADISWVKRKYLDIPYANQSPAQRLDLYLPEEGEGPFPLVVHIHGGGFGMGDKRDDHMDTYLKGLAHGYAIVSVEYRLSGEAIFSAAVLDCREAFRFLRKHAAEYSIDPDRICALGGSAGGNLAAIMGMNIPNGQFPGEEELTLEGDCSVQAAVDQFGPMDVCTMDDQARANGVSFVDHDTPPVRREQLHGRRAAYPVRRVAGQGQSCHLYQRQDGPMLVEHGCVDKLVPFMQSVNFVNAIYQKLGQGRVEFVPLPNADHEDKEYSSEWNMNVLWTWLDKICKLCYDKKKETVMKNPST